MSNWTYTSLYVQLNQCPTLIIEQLTFDPHITTLLLPCRRVLEEMQKQESQRALYLSHMPKLFVVDHSLFNEFEFRKNQNKHIHHVVTILHTVRSNVTRRLEISRDRHNFTGISFLICGIVDI